jgi:hypothetical protein
MGSWITTTRNIRWSKLSTTRPALGIIDLAHSGRGAVRGSLGEKLLRV